MSASTPTMRSVEGTTASALEQALERLTSLRQYQHQGKRVPHKPLLVLLALGQLEATGSSAVTWEQAQTRLAELIREFGPQTKTSAKQSAAYPFTRLRSDGVWSLDAAVPDDLVGILDRAQPTGPSRPDASSPRSRPSCGMGRPAPPWPGPWSRRTSRTP